MKSITFDQLKNMLKSMSNAIFKRLGNVSNRVDAVEKKVNTFKQPKTIIIERDSALSNGTATSDTPFDEAWAMSDAELTASIVVTTKSYNHVYISSSVASVEHINVMDQKMLRIITNDYYDGSKGERHHNEINWYKINGINVFDRKAFITVERYHIAELMNKTSSFTLAQDSSLDLATMSESTKGGAKLGEGLEVVDDALRVKPEGVYELIEKIIVGYELLTAKPEDWETNWTAYYRNTGTTKEPTYTLINDASAPVWETRKYYKLVDESNETQVIRTTDHNGVPYKLKALMVLTKIKGTDQLALENKYLYVCPGSNGYHWTSVGMLFYSNNPSTQYDTRMYARTNKGTWELCDYHGMHTAFSNMIGQTTCGEVVLANASDREYITYLRIFVHGGVLPRNLEIEIWGVRA